MQDELIALVAQRAGIDARADARTRTWAKLRMGCLDAAYRLWLDRGGDLDARPDAAFTATRDAGSGAACAKG